MQQAIALEIDARVIVVEPVCHGRLWRTVTAVALFWSVVWCAAALYLWLAQSLLLFNVGESRWFTSRT
jgi:hypothetical protein